MEKLDKHSEYVSLVKSYGETAIKNVVIKWVVSQLPFFASGPWNWVLVKVASKLAAYAVEQVEIAVFFTYVDFRTNGQARDFEAAMIANYKAQLEGTDKEKEVAENNLKIALKNLVYLKS